MNQWIKYSQTYKCTVAEAIRDRDFPMVKEICISQFKEATGMMPTEEEIKIMQPDSEEAVAAEWEETIRDWR